MRKFGLIGRTLKHSFSKKYFTDKFGKEGITNSQYELFELSTIDEFPDLIQKKPDLVGLNVTIPYKKEVIPFLDQLDENAAALQAVNTIKITKTGLKGFNTDYVGFKQSLENWSLYNVTALILGTGGASNAVKKVLEDINIQFQMVSRSEGNDLTYEQLSNHPELVQENRLIINTTPLGTFPDVEESPRLPYNQLGQNHFLFDLVYNPEVTRFMQHGIKAGATVQNGYDMLVGQAEAAWKIWNSN